MLGKLMKYDFKGVARYMLPLYALLLISTCGMKLTLEMSENTIINVFRTLFIAAYVISIIAICVGSIIVLILRFYRNLMTDEGYLSFTLPVSPTTHLVSKLLNGIIWIIFTILMVILSVLLLTAGQVDWSESMRIFRQVLAEMNSYGLSNLHLLLYFAYAFLMLSIGSQIVIYFCICGGQLFGSHRVLGAFVVYFCWYVVQQVGGLTILATNIKSFEALNSDLTLLQPSTVIGMVDRLFLSSFLFSLVCYVALFFATRYLITKKLNLE